MIVIKMIIIIVMMIVIMMMMMMIMMMIKMMMMMLVMMIMMMIMMMILMMVMIIVMMIMIMMVIVMMIKMMMMMMMMMMMIVLMITFFDTQETPHNTLVTIMDEADRKNGNTQGDKAQTNLLRRTAAADPPCPVPVVQSHTPKPKPPSGGDTHWIDKLARVLFPICYFSFIFAYFAYYSSVLDYSLKLF